MFKPGCAYKCEQGGVSFFSYQRPASITGTNKCDRCGVVVAKVGSAYDFATLHNLTISVFRVESHAPLTGPHEPNKSFTSLPVGRGRNMQPLYKLTLYVLARK